ncbi:MAG: ABC transporter permease [Formivibrio sp.]|nr:ABC transporter permease [Formivibrio sp.]
MWITENLVVDADVIALVIGTVPWYAPQYAIPLLGMVLGNTMNGISLGLDRLTQDAVQKRLMIETRLALAESWIPPFQTASGNPLGSG